MGFFFFFILFVYCSNRGVHIVWGGLKAVPVLLAATIITVIMALKIQFFEMRLATLEFLRARAAQEV